MNNFVGVLLFTLSSAVGGTILGALFGLISTAINNFILHSHFGAAIGSYKWWISFHMLLWTIAGGLIALCWGLFLVFQGQHGSKLG